MTAPNAPNGQGETSSERADIARRIQNARMAKGTGSELGSSVSAWMICVLKLSIIKNVCNKKGGLMLGIDLVGDNDQGCEFCWARGVDEKQPQGR